MPKTTYSYLPWGQGNATNPCSLPPHPNPASCHSFCPFISSHLLENGLLFSDFHRLQGSEMTVGRILIRAVFQYAIVPDCAGKHS